MLKLMLFTIPPTQIFNRVPLVVWCFLKHIFTDSHVSYMKDVKTNENQLRDLDSVGLWKAMDTLKIDVF